MTETSMNTSNPYEGEGVPGTVGFPLLTSPFAFADPEAARRSRKARSASSS